MRLSSIQEDELKHLAACRNRGAFATEPLRRSVAYELEKMKLAEWKGESFGTSMWAITDLGMEKLNAS